MKIYVASSWRNDMQPGIVEKLRGLGHDVYDFKNPKPGDNGFHWSEINPKWKAGEGQRGMTLQQYRDEALTSPIAEAGFKSDFDAMKWADACVLVLPCGRSAHLEASWFSGEGRPLVIMLSEEQFCPELMYKLTPHICLDRFEVRDALEIEQKRLDERNANTSKDCDPDEVGC